jgi:cytochrome c oxidase subunit 3
MADQAVMVNPHGEAFEPPLLGTYSKKLGMWLFLLSDSLTFGALLYAYSYGRMSTPGWPTPFHAESIATASIMTAFLLSSSLTMVLAVLASQRGDQAWTRNWLLATMALGAGFVVLHGFEWAGLIKEGMTPVSNPWAPTVPQFGGTFFALTGMHMLHVTLGVAYLGVIALRRLWVPILLVLWLGTFLLTPSEGPGMVFHYGSHVLLVCAVIAAIIVWLKPKKYDANDVEVSGLYWHFVDLVWMFIFPLVYLMSTRIE